MHGHCGSDLAFIPKEMEKEEQEQVCGSASPGSGEERIWRLLERTTWFGQLAIGGKKLQFSPSLLLVVSGRKSVTASEGSCSIKDSHRIKTEE